MAVRNAGADCCALVFDVNSAKSFENLEGWREEFLSHQQSSLPFVLIGNKIDMDKRAVSEKRARQWALDKGMEYFETSAKDNVCGAYLG